MWVPVTSLSRRVQQDYELKTFVLSLVQWLTFVKGGVDFGMFYTWFGVEPIALDS